MKVGLQLSLTLGTFAGRELVNLFDRFIKFEPYMFARKTKTQAWNERKHRKIMQNYDGEGFLAVSDFAGNSFSIGETNKKHSYLSLKIEQEEELFRSSTDEMNSLLEFLPGIISAYLYNGEYVNVQSDKFSSNLTGRDMPKEVMDSIRSTQFSIGVHGREYEVRFNPGRKILMDYSYLLAAWKIWLAAPFFVLVSKDKIMSFPHAVDIKELPSGLVYVQLFERMEESYTPESMFRQWKWQEWLDFDELIRSQDSS